MTRSDLFSHADEKLSSVRGKNIHHHQEEDEQDNLVLSSNEVGTAASAEKQQLDQVEEAEDSSTKKETDDKDQTAEPQELVLHCNEAAAKRPHLDQRG